jgi:hypothetical protein
MGPSSVTCSLCSKFREKRIRVIALGKHRVFAVTRHRYSLLREWRIAKENGACAIKKNVGPQLQTI